MSNQDSDKPKQGSDKTEIKEPHTQQNNTLAVQGDVNKNPLQAAASLSFSEEKAGKNIINLRQFVPQTTFPSLNINDDKGTKNETNKK